MAHSMFIGKPKYADAYFVNTGGEDLMEDKNAIKFIGNDPVPELLDYLKSRYKKDQKAHLVGISPEILTDIKERILKFIKDQHLKITIEDRL
jgi:hypothetical protein